MAAPILRPDQGMYRHKVLTIPALLAAATATTHFRLILEMNIILKK